MGHHPAVVYAVADRLAQPEGEWAPFDRSGWRSLVYPDPEPVSARHLPGIEPSLSRHATSSLPCEACPVQAPA